VTTLWTGVAAPNRKPYILSTTGSDGEIISTASLVSMPIMKHATKEGVYWADSSASFTVHYKYSTSHCN